MRQSTRNLHLDATRGSLQQTDQSVAGWVPGSIKVCHMHKVYCDVHYPTIIRHTFQQYMLKTVAGCWTSSEVLTRGVGPVPRSSRGVLDQFRGPHTRANFMKLVFGQWGLQNHRVVQIVFDDLAMGWRGRRTPPTPPSPTPTTC